MNRHAPLHLRIYTMIAQSEWRGWSADELSVVFEPQNIRHNAVEPALRKLEETRRIVCLKDTRKTRTDSDACLYVLPLYVGRREIWPFVKYVQIPALVFECYEEFYKDVPREQRIKYWLDLYLISERSKKYRSATKNAPPAEPPVAPPAAPPDPYQNAPWRRSVSAPWRRR